MMGGMGNHGAGTNDFALLPQTRQDYLISKNPSTAAGSYMYAGGHMGGGLTSGGGIGM